MKIKPFISFALFITSFVCAGNAVAQTVSAPVIRSIQGSDATGSTLTITGVGFTEKNNAKPLLFWSADTGTLPSTAGRKTQWDARFSGEIVNRADSSIVAPGSSYSLRHDYSLYASAILGRVAFNSDHLYVWRKRYDDFDRSKDYAIRTRYNTLVKIGNVAAPAVGMIMADANKTVYGKINQIFVTNSTSGAFYFSNSFGKLTDKTLIKTVKMGETMYLYAGYDTAMTTPIFSFVNAEGAGIYHTFNHKIIRLWAKYGALPNNSYISLDKDGMMVSEHTQVKSFFVGGWDNIIYSATRRWATEEFEYRAGTVDNVDGVLNFWQDGVRAWGAQRFRFTTSTNPNKYTELYQTQVSNGAHLGSMEYFDSLYVDDTLHRIVICSASTWSACKKPEVLLPISWNNNQISATLRKGGLYDQISFYVYVFNNEGIPNEKGALFCPTCPAPPTSL